MGIFSIGCVQGIVNQKHYGKFSILVNTNMLGPENPNTGEKTGLFNMHLFDGIGIGYYETYMGGEDYLHGYSYWDVAGLEIVRAENPTDYSLKGYLKIVCKYPISMLGVYVRHFLVLMNPMNAGGYVFSRNSRIILTFLNYSLLFVSMIYLLRKIKKVKFDLKEIFFLKKLKNGNDIFASKKKTSILSLIILLAPFIAIIPGSMEERFGMPFWLVIYGLLSYVIDIKKEYLRYKMHSVFYIIIWFVGFMFIIALLTTIYAQNLEGIYLPLFDL